VSQGGGATNIGATLGTFADVLVLAVLLLAGSPGPARGGEAGSLFREPEDASRRVAALATWPDGDPGGLYIAADTAKPDGPKVENLFSRAYAQLVWDDTCHVLTAPTRWDATDWGVAAVATVAVVGTAYFLDDGLQKAIQKNRNSTADAIARDSAPFGAEYSFIVLAGFELEGLIFDDDESRAVAQDGLAASIIAGGITEGLKLSVGRLRPNQHTAQGRKGVHYFEPFHNDPSFPSGHTTQAFAVATVISEHYDSLAVDIGAYGLAALVGYSRLESNSHYVSDVLAGAFIGTAVGRAVTSFNKSERWGVGPAVDEHGMGLQLIVKF
jgi:membrane-associated phospholipid phosphatase